MTTTQDTIHSIKGTSKLVRARFGPGMLLQHEDLEQLNAYTRELSRLMFRSLFGCGVVCGLQVGAEAKCGKVTVTVSAGLALDCSGDPVYLPRDQTLTFDEDCLRSDVKSVWVLLCSHTKCCAPRPAVCASDEDETPSVCTRERDGFEIRIVSARPPCICGCPEGYVAGDRASECGCVDPSDPCYKDHYLGKCGCHGGEQCDCACECILLARLDKPHYGARWPEDHSVRRFIRPVLMRDPLSVTDLGLTAEPPSTTTPEPTPQPAQATRKPRRRG